MVAFHPIALTFSVRVTQAVLDQGSLTFVVLTDLKAHVHRVIGHSFCPCPHILCPLFSLRTVAVKIVSHKRHKKKPTETPSVENTSRVALKPDYLQHMLPPWCHHPSLPSMCFFLCCLTQTKDSKRNR